MSFGVYRPSMGVAHGHRELSSNQTLFENRRQKEQMWRKENPITGEGSGGGSTGLRRPPSGNLQSGLQPKIGPMDHMTLPDKDVPCKRVDPTKNQSSNLTGGIACVPTYEERARGGSRLTEGTCGDVLQMRESTPERRGSSSRRSSPGQVLKGNLRPKDNLSVGGCVVADRPAVDPMGFNRKAGSGPSGIGSGGSGHLLQGPGGFVPIGPDYNLGAEATLPTAVGASVPYRPVWGPGAARSM